MLTINMKKSRYWMTFRIRSERYVATMLGLIDTGAKGTIMPQMVLQSLPDIVPIRKNVSRSGAVPGAYRHYSEYEVSFIIDGKCLDNIHIFIPEDDKPTTVLIGIDVLSRIDFYQLADSYRLHCQIKNPKFHSEYVTYSNVNEALMYILKEKKRSDLFSVLHQYIPADINMSSDDFYVLVSRMLRKLHMT